MQFRPWIFVGLIAAACLPGCGKKEENSDSSASAVFDTPWSCEEHWMVAATVGDLQGMAKLGGTPIGSEAVVPAKAPREYQVGRVTLRMSPSCWDLASYQPLLGSWKPAPVEAAGNGPDLLHDLLTPTAKSLQKANKVVSERIKATPLAAVVHEEAAFLLGVCGMRENSRQFSDLRPLLCRMTAHLAMADHLRGGKDASNIGRWARVFYDYHAGRPMAAREEMKTIAADGDSGRWKRVIELLITGDWRRMEDLAEPSLAESIAHARALSTHLGIPEMMKFVGERKDLQATPEWSRLLSGPGKSVDEGHLAMSSCVPMEFFEIREVFKVGKEPTPEELAVFLVRNEASGLVGADGVPRVISDSDWAAYFRRHFYMVCSDINRFAIRKWASPEAADEWSRSMLPYCLKWPDHALVEPLLATRDKVFQSDLLKTAEYIRQHPEQVPMGLWYDYRFPNLETVAQTEMPNQIPWFREVSPPGTAHDPCQRIRFSAIQDGEWVNHIRRLYQINPWNPVLCYELAENTGNTPESVKTTWGAIREYSKRPLTQSLEGSGVTREQRIETLRTLVPLDPDAGLDLGATLVIADLPDEAIKAYEKAYEKCTDRVAVANRSRWMIYYYKTHNQEAKAREVADHNAKVFSASGLESALALAIADKDAKRAAKIADDLDERYGDKIYQFVAAWYAGGDAKALKRIFPAGPQEATLAGLESANANKGCRLRESSEVTRAIGLRQGDIILAIDGKRVENYEQYLMILSSTLDPHTRLIWRRGKKFSETECMLPDRRLQVGIDAVGR